MSTSVGPVAGLVVKQFYNDEAFWQGAWTEDEEFLVDGRAGQYYEFADGASVTVAGGDVYMKSGQRKDLTEFFREWLERQPVYVVVPVPQERQKQLEALLQQNGFTFAYSRPPETQG